MTSIIQDDVEWNLTRYRNITPGVESVYEQFRDGEGVWVYILDTRDIMQDTYDLDDLSRFEKLQSIPLDATHPQRVASLVCGELCGVAKRVFVGNVAADTSTQWTSGCNAIIAHAAAHGGPAVMTTSVSWPDTTAPEILAEVEAAIQSVIDAGILVIASAGNTSNVATSTPAIMSDVLTVGGLNRENGVYPATSYGPSVEVYAPVVWVRQGDFPEYEYTGDNYEEWFPGYRVSTGGGTSWGPPQVAGLCALILQFEPNLTPAQLKQRIIDDAVPGITNLPGVGSHDRIVQSPYTAGAVHSLPSASAYVSNASADMVVDERASEEIVTVPSGTVDQSGNPVDVTSEVLHDVVDPWDSSTYVVLSP